MVSRPMWRLLTTPMTLTKWSRTAARGRSLEGWGDVVAVSSTHWLRSAALTADLGRRIPAFDVFRSALPHTGLQMFVVLSVAILVPWLGHNMNCPQFYSFINFVFVSLPLLTAGGRRLLFSGGLSSCPSICALSICSLLMSVPRDMMSAYLMDRFQWNLTQLFIIWMAIAGKVFKVRKGQRLRSW